MATGQHTIDYIIDQLSSLSHVSARKMFGEYALYCNGKVVGLVCDDALFVKITVRGREFVGDYYQEGRAFRGAKPSMLIDEAQIEDREWISELIQITFDDLPYGKVVRR